jgi:glycosyltransferase involved in cell wall biosynthesis
MKVLIINNIPTPYRNFFYKEISKEGAKHDVDFTIAFQGEKGVSHKSKYQIWWTIDDLKFNFKHFFSKNIFGKRHTYHSRWSTNVDVLLHILTHKYDAILAPPSMSIFNWIYCVLPTRARKILYSETNLHVSSTQKGVMNTVRKLLFSNFDAIAVPGRYALDWLYTINPDLKEKPVLHLPNVIDSNAFNLDTFKHKSKGDYKVKYNLPRDKMIITAIGIADYKGKRKLIESIKNVEGDYQILILGGGDTFKEYDELIKREKLETKVSLLGNKSENEVRDYLFLSDWFIHPSSFDPSPLVLVEAAFMGLPLATTSQTGNNPELLIENENGYVFDYNEDFAPLLKKMIHTSQSDLIKMGQKSLEIAYQNFDSSLICKKMVSELLKLNK